MNNLKAEKLRKILYKTVDDIVDLVREDCSIEELDKVIIDLDKIKDTLTVDSNVNKQHQSRLEIVDFSFGLNQADIEKIYNSMISKSDEERADYIQFCVVMADALGTTVEQELKDCIELITSYRYKNYGSITGSIDGEIKAKEI